MSERYFVVGGTYTDTSFSEIAGGGKATRLGPFDSYDEAKAVWRAKAMETVDEAYARYSIEREENTEFWVVGGSYTDTDFKTIRNGAEEERYGPYTSQEQAKAVWKEKAMSTVDDAYARYRIEEL